MSDFPSEKNPQPCKNGCGTKIYLSDKKQKGRWLPYDSDNGTVHDCPKKLQNGSTTIKPDNSKEDKVPTIKELDARLRKLESLVLGD